MANVLVVGAGPAGIAACETLVENGLNATLIDRHKRPGIKACAGGLTKESWGPAGIDPKDPPDFARTFGGILVASRLGEIRVGETALEKGDEPLLITIDRPTWQSEKILALKKMGVEIALGERLHSIGDRKALTDRGERRFDWLVGADGASSRTRLLLGLKREFSLRARQVRIDASSLSGTNIDLKIPRIWFDSSIAPPGYAWSFPCGEEVRLGLGASTESLKRGELKEIFNRLLQRVGLDPSMGLVQTGTIGCGYSGHRFGRVLLVGDAAGLASPLTGEGIGQALISGREAALEIVNPSYRSKKIAELARRHRRTREMLANGFFGGPSLALAPYLLRVPFIRKETFRRYI